MAEDFQEKTEEATPKKLADARKKGQVARSQEFTSAIMLMIGMLILYLTGSFLLQGLQQLCMAVWTNLLHPFDSVDVSGYWFRQGVMTVVGLVAPMLVGLFIVAFLVSVVQVGVHLSVEPLKPKWKTANIFDVSNYKRFFNVQVLMRSFLGMCKIAVVFVICFVMIRKLLPQVARLIYATTGEIFEFVAWQGFIIGTIIAVVLLVLGVMDLVFQKWKFKQDMRMTKQEIKDERKQSEGDAQVKGKMRSMMQAFARSRMKDSVPKSDVVIANPIHFAVALKYDEETMAAPVCVAKGARKMAIIIKELANSSGVPIVENPPLAQALYKAAEVGGGIPPALYHGVAEVLAYVYRLNERVAAQGATSAGPGSGR